MYGYLRNYHVFDYYLSPRADDLAFSFFICFEHNSWNFYAIKSIIIHSSREVGIYKRKQESKKARKKEKRTRPRKRPRKKENKNSTKKAIKKIRKKNPFFLISFLVEFLFSNFLVFFHKFPPLY